VQLPRALPEYKNYQEKKEKKEKGGDVVFFKHFS